MATPPALSLDANARARERKRNNGSLLLAAILFSPTYLSFIIEIYLTYVEDKLPRLLTQTTRDSLEHRKPENDRVLHGDASGDLDRILPIPEDENSSSNLRQSETVTRGWGRDSPKWTNRVGRRATDPPTQRRPLNSRRRRS